MKDGEADALVFFGDEALRMSDEEIGRMEEQARAIKGTGGISVEVWMEEQGWCDDEAEEGRDG